MKILTVTLKQHTPLIHFQHSQYGATLRASEVKPKLDKFLLKKLGGNVDKTWLIGKDDSPALNYKMRISADKGNEFMIASYLGNKEIDVLNRKNISYIASSPYFAQEKENKDVARGFLNWNQIGSKGVMLNNVTLIISSFNGELVEKIKQYIQAFFLVENFGTRQSKGFGCFVVKTLDGQSIPDGTNELLLASNFKFCFGKEIPNASLSTIFRVITEDYRLLKSGSRSPYKKSKLMEYGFSMQQDGKRLRWEKKFFKEQINKKFKKSEGEYYELKSSHKKEEAKPIESSEEQYVYLRALLGLAGQYEFLLENPPENYKKMVVSVNSVDGVDRFKSPILFKVIGTKIYIVGNEEPKEILNRSFRFKVTVQKDGRYKNQPVGSVLKTPSAFDLAAFMETNVGGLGYKKIRRK